MCIRDRKNRPEIHAAIKQVKAGSQQLGVTQHELLPALNLVTETYLNGLRGNSDFGRAFTDQFSAGRPSYSIGLQYELPVGNRLAKARVCRRQHEVARLQDEYAQALQAVQTEVDIAVRELKTAYLEIRAKHRALAAAEAEANTIEQRWLRLIDGSGTSALNLESLLRAQERVTASERDYVDSVLTYNLAMINLKRSNGTLLQSENVNVSNGRENRCKAINLDKGHPVQETFSDQSIVGSAITISETPPPLEQAPPFAPAQAIEGSHTRAASRPIEVRIDNVPPAVPAAFDYYAK